MSAKSPLVLITGATGALGPRVTWTIAKAGYRLRTLSSKSISARLLPPNCDNRIGDIAHYQSVARSMEGVDIVIHMAALLHITDASSSETVQYQRINVGGTKNIVQAAQQEGVRRLVYFSTIAVYGNSIGGIATEETRPAPDTEYAKTKLDAESVVLAANRQDGASLGTVLRLAATYGPRVKGNYFRLLMSLDSGRFLPLGRGKNRRTMVYDRDVAQAVLLAATHPAAAGQVYNVTDGCFHTVTDIIAEICHALSRRPPRFRLPLKPIHHIVGLSEDVLGFFSRKSPITQAAIEKYTEDIAVDGCRIQEQLGFSPRYDLAAGWKETVAEMKRSGDL